MTRDKIINVISTTLSIEKKYLTEETNLDLLFILSDYMDGLNVKVKNSLKISKDGLKRKTPLTFKYENYHLLAEINFLFADKENQSVIYRTERGHDTFCGFDLVHILFAFTIEKELGIQITDEKWENMETIGQALLCIEEELRQK